MSRVVQGENNNLIRGFSSTHKGGDIGHKGGDNDNILAHSDGKVIMVVTGKKRNVLATGTASYGNFVKIKHSNGYYTLYAHLSSVNVKVGQYVKQGQKIGYMGESGRTFGKHLHYEVRTPNDVRIDPAPYLNADLPGTSNCIMYQAYDMVKKKWLPNVVPTEKKYAGNIGNPISAILIDSLTYRVHDKKKNKWLPWVTGRKDYAGNLGNAIDGIQIKNVSYRVHIKGGKWLSWVNKVDNTPNGYAGIYGKEIDAIQIK